MLASLAGDSLAVSYVSGGLGDVETQQPVTDCVFCSFMLTKNLELSPSWLLLTKTLLSQAQTNLVIYLHTADGTVRRRRTIEIAQSGLVRPIAASSNRFVTGSDRTKRL